jgi:hypothetical protein
MTIAVIRLLVRLHLNPVLGLRADWTKRRSQSFVGENR